MNNFIKLQNFYKDKQIFLTGHTGFKGSWLLLMLHHLGAKVHAYSLEPEDIRGNFFNLAKLDQYCEASTIADIRDAKNFEEKLLDANPDLVFHLAAQPSVLRSYGDPLDTISSNVIGTTNLYEIIRTNNTNVKSIINITSDKCYENRETLDAYKEDDAFGGYDPYSASKGMCEILSNSYRRSFFNDMNISLTSCRAGNVIGGGDFGENRIIPDIIENIQKNEIMDMRAPNAIRPWQHVLDVLYGYLLAGVASYQDTKQYSGGYNFAPPLTKDINVQTLVDNIIKELGTGEYKIEENNKNKHEAHFLKLNAEKARREFAWENLLDFENTCKFTANWFKQYLNGDDVNQFSNRQLEQYFGLMK